MPSAGVFKARINDQSVSNGKDLIKLVMDGTYYGQRLTLV
jgi:hypothetical protein